MSVVAPESKALDALGRLGGFVLLISWYYSIGKSQNALVIARYGKGYPRKGWLKPLSLGLLGYLGIFVLALVAAVIAGAVAGEA